MAKCNSCNSEITSGAKFCEHCGAPVFPVATPEQTTRQEEQSAYEAKGPSGDGHPPASQVRYQNDESNQQQSPGNGYQSSQDGQQFAPDTQQSQQGSQQPFQGSYQQQPSQGTYYSNQGTHQSSQVVYQPPQGGQQSSHDPIEISPMPIKQAKDSNKTIIFVILGIVLLGIVSTAIIFLIKGFGKNPYLGLWKATKIIQSGEEIGLDGFFEDAYAIELTDGSECVLVFGGQSFEGTWKTGGNKITITVTDGSDNMDIIGDIDKETMLFKNFVDTGMDVTFEKSDGKLKIPKNTVHVDDPDDWSNVDRDIYIGFWDIDMVEIDGEEHDPVDATGRDIIYFDIKDDGTAILDLDGDKMEGTYTIDGENIKLNIEMGTFHGIFENNMMRVKEWAGIEGMDYIFRKRTESSNSAKQGSIETNKSDIGGDSNLQDYWGKNWFGYLWITDAYGKWEELEDVFYDTHMVLNIDEGGNGDMYMYLGDTEDSSIVSHIIADEDHIEITEGYFWDMELDTSTWWIAPSPVDEGTLLVMGDIYIDPETESSGFDFMICVRPFGERWEQEVANEEHLPPGFEQYIKALDSGATDSSGLR